MSSWKEKELGEICKNNDGTIRTGPFGSQLHKSDYQENGIPVVMPKDLFEQGVNTSTIARIGEFDVDRLSQHKLKKGDILYARRGDIGKRAFVTEKEEGWLCGTGCLKLNPGNCEVNPKYLFYYLGDRKVTEWIYNQAVGATMANLNTAILSSVRIRYPKLEAQQKIASILSAFDDLIENNTRRIAILEETARLIYREWFVHYRYPGHENDRLVDSGMELGKVPEGWEVKNLEDLCELIVGQSPKSEFYNNLGDGLPFHQGVKDFESRFPRTTTWCTEQKRIAEQGDILFSVRAPVGRINIANCRMVIGRGLHAIRSKNGNQVFIYEQLKNKFQEEDSIGSGTIYNSVSKGDMLGLKLIYPGKKLIVLFEENAKPIFEQIRILTEKNIYLKETRDLLLPRLVSGSVVV